MGRGRVRWRSYGEMEELWEREDERGSYGEREGEMEE